MKRIVFLWAVSSVLAAMSMSDVAAQQQSYSVRGRVIDRLTREGIPYAAVIIVGMEGSGNVADSTGVFVLDGVPFFCILSLCSCVAGHVTHGRPENRIVVQSRDAACYGVRSKNQPIY